jgi:hypothetical protein
LVAGGFDGIQLTRALKSAEIFDPATGTFAPTGDMAVARSGLAAAPLPDGRVLVAGGGNIADSPNGSASAEIFDPGTGTFSPTGSMAAPRYGGAGAPLPNGRAVVLGGEGPGATRRSPEIFDATTAKFTPAGDKTVVPLSEAAAPLPDGRVVVVGGGSGGLIFDPVTATFASTSYMPAARFSPAVAPLPDGRVLVAGGSSIGYGAGALELPYSAELFTPDLSYRMDGRKLTVSVAVAGTLTVAGASSRPSLKPTSRKGGPGLISLKLTPAGKAKRKLARTRKAKVLVRLGFVPKAVRGNCVTDVSPCYLSEYSIGMTRKLTLKAKKHK